jgi:tRNA modification GTPase
VLVVLDISQPLESADFDLIGDTANTTRLVVANKIDLPPAWSRSDLKPAVFEISSISGAGLDDLRRAIRNALGGGASASPQRDSAAVTNVRHAALLERARASLRRALDAVENPGAPVAEEFVLIDLQDARAALEEVTGKRTPEDVLGHIFSRFCVGK